MHHTHMSPCKGCQERTISPPCHDLCKKYRDYADDMVKIREKRKKDNDAEGFHFELVQKNLKRYRG